MKAEKNKTLILILTILTITILSLTIIKTTTANADQDFGGDGYIKPTDPCGGTCLSTQQCCYTGTYKTPGDTWCCPSSKICGATKNSCLDCTDECGFSGSRCKDANTLETCSDTDNDGCKEYTTTTCTYGCENNQCKTNNNPPPQTCTLGRCGDGRPPCCPGYYCKTDPDAPNAPKFCEKENLLPNPDCDLDPDVPNKQAYMISVQTINQLCYDTCGSMDDDSYRHEKDLKTGKTITVQADYRLCKNSVCTASCLNRPGIIYNDEAKIKYYPNKKITDTTIRLFYVDGCNWCTDRTTYLTRQCPNNLKVKIYDNMAYCPTHCSNDNDCASGYECTYNQCCSPGTEYAPKDLKCCGANEYNSDGHCCAKGKYWDPADNACVEGHECDLRWSLSSQIEGINGSYMTSTQEACCFQDWYASPNDYWTRYKIY